VTPDDLVLGETPCETHQSVTVRSSIRIRIRVSVIVALISVRTSLSMARMFISASEKFSTMCDRNSARPPSSMNSLIPYFKKTLRTSLLLSVYPPLSLSSSAILRNCVVRRSQETIATDLTGKYCGLSREKFTHPSGNLVSIKCKRQKGR
jgi:hypothetical protein